MIGRRNNSSHSENFSFHMFPTSDSDCKVQIRKVRRAAGKNFRVNAFEAVFGER